MRTDQQKEAIQSKRLGSTDLQTSVLGFGASPLGDVYGPVDPGESKRAVHLAVDRGINFFDASPYYGLNLAEERLGEALEGRRDKVVLATKCGRYGLKDFDFSKKRIEASIDESLRRLRTDYVDLLQVHDVEFGNFDQLVAETLPTLHRIRQSGKARYIGITGYPPKFLMRLALQVPVDSILNYCHYDLLVTDMDDELTPFAEAGGIGLINASALHMGVLTDRDSPSWHPAPVEVLNAAARIKALCQAHGKKISEVAVRFCLDHSSVSSTLVGMATREEVLANLQLLQVKSDPNLLLEIRDAVGADLNVVWTSGNPANNV